MDNHSDYKHEIARSGARAGFALVELVLASVLVAFLMTICVQMLRLATEQHRASDRRVLALQTIQNIAEQCESMPYEKLNSESVSAIEVSDAAKSFLKDAQLTTGVFDQMDPAAKRVAVELSWRDHRGVKSAPLRLTIWRYPDESSQ